MTSPVRNDWQTWMLGTLFTIALFSGGWNVTTFANDLKDQKAAQQRLQVEMAQRTTDIEVLKADMKNQTELMRTINMVLQQLVERDRNR